MLCGRTSSLVAVLTTPGQVLSGHEGLDLTQAASVAKFHQF